MVPIGLGDEAGDLAETVANIRRYQMFINLSYIKNGVLPYLDE